MTEQKAQAGRYESATEDRFSAVDRSPAPDTPCCVNLKDRYGDVYKVVYEESYYVECGPNARVVDPWLMVVICKHGEIYPWSESELVASTARKGSIAGRLKSLPYTSLHRDGADGADVIFPVDRFDEVAEIMRPRRRRRLSASERLRLAKIGAKFRFPHGAQAAKTSRICVPRPQDDSEPMTAPATAQMIVRNDARAEASDRCSATSPGRGQRKAVGRATRKWLLS
jgi:hypothetical protein